MEKEYTSTFTEETVTSIAEYGHVLRSVHARLRSEGYFLEDGRTWNIFKCATPFEVEWED